MLSIILPTYNEKDSIKKTIFSIVKILKQNNIRYEIIVSDDNSPDKTWEVVDNLSKTNKNIKILRRFENKGLSNSVIDAFQIANGQNLLVMDADGQHDEKIIPKMLEKIKTSDIIIGSRYTKNGSCGDFPFYRKIISKSASLLAYPFLMKKNTTDPMSGFFMLRKSTYMQALPHLQISGYKILLDILFASPKTIKISEVSYVFKNREFGTSKLGIGVIFDYIEMLILQFLKQNKTLIKFLIVGASGIVINLTTLYILVEYFSLNNILSSSVAVELSIVNNFFLNNHWTFIHRKKTNTILERFMKFNLVSLSSLIVNVTIMTILTNLGLWYIYAQFFGILVAFVINYIINNKWTFKKEN